MLEGKVALVTWAVIHPLDGEWQPLALEIHTALERDGEQAPSEFCTRIS